MPVMSSYELSIAVSEALDADLDDWNRAFRLAVEKLPGENHVLAVSARNLKASGDYPAEIRVTAKSQGSSVSGIVIYVGVGVRDVDTPVRLEEGT